MAIPRMGTLVGAISGRVGSVVFRNARSGLSVSQAGAHLTKQTPEALSARERMQRFAAAWNAATAETRLQWMRMAERMTKTDRLGTIKNYTPRGLAFETWSAVAWYLKLPGGFDTLPVIPENALRFTIPMSFSITATAGDPGEIEMTLDPFGDIPITQVLYSLAINPRGGLRNVRTFRAWSSHEPVATPFTLDEVNMYDGRNMAFQSGDRVCVEFRLFSDEYYFPSSRMRCETVAV